MSGKDVGLTGLAFVQDVMAAAGVPGSSLLGKAVDNALKKRRTEAIDVLIKMIEAGKAEDIQFEESDADEFVQMLMRFWQAAATGTAKRNLRFLANVILGLKRNKSFEFDKFQSYANILETLTRSEILLIGKVYKIIQADPATKNLKEQLSDTFTKNELESIFAALTRTGLFAPVSAFGTLNYRPTPTLTDLCEMAQVQEE